MNLDNRNHKFGIDLERFRNADFREAKFIIYFSQLNETQKETLLKSIKIGATQVGISRDTPIEKIKEVMEEINPIIFSESIGQQDGMGYTQPVRHRFRRNNVYIFGRAEMDIICRLILKTKKNNKNISLTDLHQIGRLIMYYPQRIESVIREELPGLTWDNTISTIAQPQVVQEENTENLNENEISLEEISRITERIENDSSSHVPDILLPKNKKKIKRFQEEIMNSLDEYVERTISVPIGGEYSNNASIRVMQTEATAPILRAVEHTDYELHIDEANNNEEALRIFRPWSGDQN